MKRYRWQNISSADIEERAENGVIIPIGNIEVHGKHLPLGTDTIIAEYFAYELAKKTDMIVAPPLNGDVAVQNFNGIISYGEELSKDMLFKTYEEVSKHTDKVFVYNGCGGNKKAVTGLRVSKGAKDLSTWWTIDKVKELDESYQDFIKDNDPFDWIGTHAGEIETSLVLYIDHTLVNKKRMKSSYGICSHDALVKKKQSMGSLEAALGEGILGDARKASVLKGKLMREIIINHNIEEIYGNNE